MNNKYIVKFNDFDEFRKIYEDKIDELRQEIFNVFKLNQETDWSGDGYESFSKLISLEISKLDRIPQVLDLYVDFMDKAINNYSEGMEEVKKSFDEILDIIRNEKIKRGEN